MIHTLMALDKVKSACAVLTATRSGPHTRSQGPIRSPVREPGAEEVTA